MTNNPPAPVPASASTTGEKPRWFVTADGRNLVVTFVLISSLFLLWGFCNGMIDVMDKHFQEELHLTLAQSAWVQFAHYLGYFLMALPAGWLASRLGYKRGIIAGLLIVAVGCLWFIPATQIAQFWAFLLGVCLIASGLTFLETIANPYATVLGSSRYAAARINLAQSCSGIGWVLGPLAGAMFFYGKDAQGQSTGSETLWIPYAGVAVVVVLLAVVFKFAQVPDLQAEAPAMPQDAAADVASKSIWSRPHFVFAVVAQFFYVAAQAGIFSFFINYMTAEPPLVASVESSFWRKLFEARPDGLLQISDQGASTLASVGFICFLAGRFIGTGLLKRYPAHLVLGCFAVLNIVASSVVVMKAGWVSVGAVFFTYFFMSIMFPTIFALGIDGLGARAKQASAYIVMAIMGGAVVPKLMGAVGDNHGMSRAFLVPLLCFCVVAAYGFLWARLAGTTNRSASRPV